MHCKICDRVKASQEQFNTLRGGEAEYLCWGEWSPQQCLQEAVDWNDKYYKLLNNFKKLDEYNEVLYRACYAAKLFIRAINNPNNFQIMQDELMSRLSELEDYEKGLKK